MDWSDCPIVETKLDIQRGRPVLKGTRMPVQDIVNNWEAGIDAPDIAEFFELRVGDVTDVLAYARNVHSQGRGRDADWSPKDHAQLGSRM